MQPLSPFAPHVRYDLGREFHRIMGPIYQGSVPPMFLEGFHTIVFCAMEHQHSQNIHFATVIHAPNDDADRLPTKEEMRVAVNAARKVAWLVRDKHRVLITCAQGRNRSGFVTALALMRLCGWSAYDTVKFIQKQRPNSLTNVHFCLALDRVK
jgi:Dual specificity phosphatase, catalytic domain